MRLSRYFATGLWLTATLLLTGMVWAATSIVAADVTDRPAPVVAHRDVLSELQSGPAINPTPTSTVPAAPTTTAPSPVGRPSPTIPRPPEPQPVPQTAPPATAPAPPPTTAPAPQLPVAPPTVPPTTQPPAPPTGTYSTSGGVVRVACNGFFIQLVSAIPNSGYTTRVVAAGPGNVDVRFVGSGQELSVKAFCFGDPVRY